MKKNYLLVLLFLLLFSCEERSNEEGSELQVYYYPEKENFEPTANKKNIFIESIGTYEDLLNEIDKVACEDSVPVINYSTSKVRFELLPWYECSEKNIISCPTFRSRIFIQNDSILTNYDIRHSIDSLEAILERHLLNKGKDFNYADSPEKAGVEIYFEKDVEFREIKSLLVKLSEEFNKLNEKFPDTLYLNILFRDYPLKRIPISPPPKQTK